MVVRCPKGWLGPVENGTGPPRVSVIVVAYNSGQLLIDVARAALRPEGAITTEVIVVNNGDHGSELDVIAELGVAVVEGAGNIGFPAGCNLGVSKSSGSIVCFLNPDAVPRPGWLGPLVEALDQEGVGSAQSLICLADQPETINTSGCVIHLTGSGWMGGFGDPVSAEPIQREIAYACGATAAMRRGDFDRLGGFCEKYFLYHEDLELGWRLRSLGLTSVLVPSSKVDHHYDFSRNQQKYFYIERNRLIFLATCVPWPILALASPVLIGFEFAVAALSIRERWFRGYLAGRRWCWSNRGWISERREEVRRSRDVGWRTLISWMAAPLDPGMIDAPPGIGLVNRILVAYWGIVFRVLRLRAS